MSEQSHMPVNNTSDPRINKHEKSAEETQKNTDGQKEISAGHRPVKKQVGAVSAPKRDHDTAFSITMHQAHSHMNTPQRLFSMFIHAKPVEVASDFIGGTIARPNALLYGSIAALIITTLIYFISKNFGYQFSGAESIAGFILGWFIGQVVDYTQLLLRGGRAKNKRS